MNIKIKMHPHPEGVKGTSGIDQVALAHGKYLPQFGIEIAHPEDDTHDLVAGHVGQGATLDRPFVCHVHGLHWTADYPCDTWQYGVNKRVIDSIRMASAVTVPSAWVAETFQRDMRFTPHIIHHGIDVDDWAHDGARGDYVLWNKNRGHDVCDAGPVVALAQGFPKQHFVSTFLPRGARPANRPLTTDERVLIASGMVTKKDVTPPQNNVNRIGLVPHDQMKQLVQNAQVYLSTTKETFGIGTLEAMASGVPVLGFAYGGNVEIIQHGVSGYLAKPGDMDDLAEGLRYCLVHREKLGANGRELARGWTWERAVEKVAGIYRHVLEPEPPTVAVVIPHYNIGVEKLERAVESVRNQSSRTIESICIVEDGSTEGDIGDTVEHLIQQDNRIKFIRQPNQGVAIARNTGIADCDAKYIACLDADDALKPEFIERCVKALEADRSLGIAYTGLWSITPDKREGLSHWPGEWEFDRHLKRQNQIPTCCVFRREMWERLGGYRQRYAPQGAGEEDAEFWLRAGAYGYKAAKVDKRGLFLYSHQSGRVSGDPHHKVTDWTVWHPWAGPDGDDAHPFASYATPERHSHPVRAYDEPTISVVIPVGPGHEKHVMNALDSLEAQTFRGWEVVVVWDGVEFLKNETAIAIQKAYPYVKFRAESAHHSRGAGWARNLGATFARAPLVLFLDADDWLRPDALELMLHAWNEHQAIIYSDYTSKAIIRTQFLRELQQQSRVHAIIKQHEIDGDTWHEVAYKSRAFDYDCERAQRQPEQDSKGNYYIWCNVTALIPLAWHQEIGGFDESLESWEDVEYHWRLAKAGHCYHRIKEELLVYNFHQGHRREKGRQSYKKLLYYISEKHKGVEIVGCRGCGGSRTSRAVHQPAALAQRVRIDDSEFVRCWYTHPNLSNHQVTGAAVHAQQFDGFRMIRRREKPPGWSINYGNRSGKRTAKFLVHKLDIAAQPHYFLPIEERQAVAVPELEKVELEEPVELDQSSAPDEITPEGLAQFPGIKKQITTGHPAAADLSEPQTLASPVDVAAIISPAPRFDLQALPGVGAALAETMMADGIDSAEKVRVLGVDGLKKYKGVGDLKAGLIMEAVSE